MHQVINNSERLFPRSLLCSVDTETLRMNTSLSDHTYNQEIPSEENLMTIDLTIDSPDPEVKTELSDNETNPVPVTNRHNKKRGHQKKIYECNLCHKQQVGIVMYKFHMKNKHRESVAPGRGAQKRTYRCSLCNQEVKGLCQYRTHLRSAHGTSLLNPSLDGTLSKCPICKITLRRCHLPLHLGNQHNTTLDKLGPFSCSYCARVFARYMNLLHHEKTVHKSENLIQDTPEIDEGFDQETKLRCLKYNQSGAFSSELAKHDQKYLGDFTSRKRLKVEKKKRFKCSLCPSAFTIKGNRATHENKFHPNLIVHKNKRRRETSTEKCTPGGVKMIYANNLYCYYCPKFFVNKYSKQLHETMHTGDRPYQCTDCGASFRLERSVLDHTKKCSDLVDLFWCDGCDFSAKSKDLLVAHYSNVHDCDFDLYEAGRGKSINGKSSTDDENNKVNCESNNDTSNREENGISNFESYSNEDISEEKFSIKDEKMALSEIKDDDNWSLIILDDDED